MTSPTSARRNDPCPCGSGLRFKACHGRLDAPNVPEASLADRGFAWVEKGDFDRGLPLLEQAVAQSPRDADARNRLGVARYLALDLEGAISELREAIRLAPSFADPHAVLALALRDKGQFERALEHAREALRLQPRMPAARFNFAMVLLALGRYEEAWPALAWRPDPRVNLRDLATPNAWPHATALPEAGAEVTLHGEQGLGDTLFFLRFAPELRRRGLRLRFWGDARLAPLLTRSGVVDVAFPASATPPALDPSRLLWIAELPVLLGGPVRFPEPLSLRVDEARQDRWRAVLSSLGPPPYVALTWQAGTGGRGKTMLAKAVPPERLGRALGAVRATFVSVQRNPVAGQADALRAALGAPLHDLSACNGDLDDALAVMSLVDEYIGVSNTNMHLRAGAGRVARVLVPWPAEWRWGRQGASPWFPGFTPYRAGPDGWSGALESLAAELG
ncbi:MAG TPA: tetratricopeptide repeat protein [Usitatibacter sp.]|nr:tetratricopeptide repeat protein [Usitatibacter sp.]